MEIWKSEQDRKRSYFYAKKQNRGQQMYIDIETILKLASLIGAMGVIGGFLIAIYKFYQKPHETEKKLKKLQELHMDDMKKINEEQCLITYGLLACLKGLQEQGCNGPVTEAINRIQKHLNKQAHDMEE